MSHAEHYELIGRFIYGYQRAAGGLERLEPLIDVNDEAAMAEFTRLRAGFAELTEWQQQLLANAAAEKVDTDTLAVRNAELAEYAHDFARLCERQSNAA
jgi:hypothetical protein